MDCRHCSSQLKHTFVDLGFSPPSNAYLIEEQLYKIEKYYPLRVKLCDQCGLVQTEDYAQAAELFDSDYAYFSSTSSSWLRHAEQYCETVVKKLNLTKESFVIEIASNDGYLLRNFVSRGIPCLGIEPTASTAQAAEKIGVPVIQKFFGTALSTELTTSGKKADLIIGNNVYAHVPDINDFTLALANLLNFDGTITLEFPHLLQLIKNKQFDTIYHEHFSYFSLKTVKKIFDAAKLKIFSVEELSTHGGSLRVYGCHATANRDTDSSVESILEKERCFGLDDLDTYLSFQGEVDAIKDDLLLFLIRQKKEGKKVAAYGAAAKGNTLLNYAGIKRDLISFVVDASRSKQGKYLPGSHVPIFSPARLKDFKLDFLIVFPWNIVDEIISQNSDVLDAGTKIVTAIPHLKIL